MKDSIITEYSDYSAFSGKPKEHTHHCVFGRGMRNLADEDKLTIGVTLAEHEFIHNNPIAADMSKMIGQLAYEKELYRRQYTMDGSDPAREEFRKRYGKSYL